MITTTLNRIRDHHPCQDGWEKLLKHIGKTKADDEPLPLLTILESNGLDDALWCLRTIPEHDREWRLFAVWCARQVQHLMTDPRSISALDVAEQHSKGDATDYELAAARAAAGAATGAAAWASADAAWAAADAARDAAGDAARAAARDAARAAAWAAARAAQRAAADAALDAAEAAARAAAWAAARDAAWAAAWAAADAARDAADAARAAARDAARDAAWAAQRAELIRIIS